MSTSTTGIIISVAVLIVAVLLAKMFNGMIRSRNTCDKARSEIDVQVKRRHDQFSNDAVLKYNSMIQSAPRRFVAGPLHFAVRQFFGITPDEHVPVKVEF